MSVPKGKRGVSELQFMITAIDLRREITNLLLRDFGLKDKVRTVEQYAKIKKMLEKDESDFLEIVRKYHMSDGEAETLLEIVDKYRMSDADRERFVELVSAYNMNDLVIEQYPKWLVDKLRSNIMDILEDLHMNLTMANSIYPVNESEFNERRLHQDRAIGNCFQLFQEMQYVITVFPINKQKYMRYTDMIEAEIALIKGWRKSDNKILKRIQNEQKPKAKSEAVVILEKILDVLVYALIKPGRK